MGSPDRKVLASRMWLWVGRFCYTWSIAHGRDYALRREGDESCYLLEFAHADLGDIEDGLSGR